MKLLLSIFSITSLLMITGCEGDFAGDRSSNVTILNGVYKMRLLEVGGETKLAVLNTNYSFTTAEGSLQFYDVGATEEDADLTIRLPNNVSDFLLYDDALFIIDRNEDRILIYDWDGQSFNQRRAAGDPVVIETLRNPQSLTTFSGTVDEAVGAEPLLAVTIQTSGTIQFYRLSQDLEEVGVSNLDTEQNDGAEVLVIGLESGALLEMIPRQESLAGSNDRIDIPFSHQIGRGVEELVVIGGEEQVIVTNNALSNALFGFHFRSFDNASNFVWDLEQYVRGFDRVGLEKYEGTGERGFRGLAIDGSNRVFASSRADNSIYRLEGSLFAQSRAPRDEGRGRNTRGFNENERTYRLDITFDTDDTDDVFPRLGDLTVNDAGTTGWVVGLGTDKVYRAALEDGGTVTSADVGDLPQSLLYDEDNDRLYVSAARGDKISVFEASTLSLVYEIGN